MHELSLTREIVSIVCTAAAGRCVHQVSLKVGRLSGVAPDAIAFCFEAVAQGTSAEGARLNMTMTDGEDLAVTTIEIEEAM